MPFAVRFHTCNLDAVPEVRRDPMTGATLPFAVESGLTPAERRAVHARLTAGGVGPDAFGRFRVFFPGGRWAEADFPGLLGGRCVGGSVVGGDPSPELIRLAWELATAGGCVLLPDGVTRPLVPSEPLRQKVIRRWPNAVVIPTVAALWQLLAPPPPPEEPETDPDVTPRSRDPESAEGSETPAPDEAPLPQPSSNFYPPGVTIPPRRANHTGVTTHDRFLSLLAAHRRPLLKVCWAYGRTPHDRDDLFQEIAARMWSAFARYDPARPFPTWMYRVALNVAIDFRRRQRRWGRDATPLDADPAVDDAEKHDQLRDLRELLDRQTEADRAILLLYLEGQSYREIGDVLGVSETNVGTRLNRLKKSMRQSAQDPEEGA